MKKKSIFVISFAAFLFMNAGYCIAAEKGAAAQKPEDIKKPKKSLSERLKGMPKDEIIKEIEELLNKEKGAINTIPYLRKKVDADGKPSYFFVDNGRLVPFSDVEKRQLEKINVGVRTAISRIRAERVNKQIEQIQQMQRMQALQRQALNRVPQVPSIPASSPKIPAAVPPAPPSTPKTPPQPPVVPKR